MNVVRTTSMRKHRKYAKNEENGENSNLTFDCGKCVVCNTKFKRKDNLLRHSTSNNFEVADNDRRGLGFVGSMKTATKGLNKAQNKLRKDNFLNVLKAKVSGSGTNRAYLIST